MQFVLAVAVAVVHLHLQQAAAEQVAIPLVGRMFQIL
jgi:hypothetical protein